MSVPFVDLRAQYEALKSEIDPAIQTVIDGTAFIGGKDNPFVRTFEESFAAWLGVDEAIGCANGTDAIEILLQAAGIGAGDEVIVPALTWISTGEAVTTIGATPVFADIDPATFTIDPASVEQAITERTKAIIPVHLYGHPADMGAIMAIAERHGLLVLEDCAQAHGAKVGGRMVGTIGDMASFSYYPGKNLGAYGDAGGMVARDPAIAQRARMLANHGQSRKHDHQFEGRNSRLDGIQAAVLSVKLPHLDGWNARRGQAARKLTAGIAARCPGVVPPQIADGSSHVFHLYVVRNRNRDGLAQALKQAGIANAVHYPIPLPLMPAYARFGHTAADFPAAVTACAEILSLPMYPELGDAEIEAIVSVVETFARTDICG